MKKILVVAFCLMVGGSVSAQEEAVVDNVQEGAAATIVEAPAADSAIVTAPQEAEAPAPDVAEESETAIVPEVVAEEAAVEGTTPSMPLVEQPVVSGVVAPTPCTGCGQAMPAMNYDAGMSYVPSVTYAQAAPCTGCGTSAMAAPAMAAPVVAAPATAPATYCCNPAPTRQRFRNRTTLRDRRNSRRNPCCN